MTYLLVKSVGGLEVIFIRCHNDNEINHNEM